MSAEFFRTLCGAIARISRDKGGAAATILVIALPGMIGVGALGAEAGVWFAIKLQNQSAADSAAISAAYEVIAGRTDAPGELTAAADEAARRNGYKGITPVVVYPYSDGSISDGIAVTLQQSQGALLAAMFLPVVTITNTAVAVIEVLDTPCILALGKDGGSGVEIAAAVRLEMPNCSAVANSIGSTAIELDDSTSSIRAATLVTAGEVSLSGTPIDPAAPPPQFDLSTPALIGAPTVADPYAGVLTHSFLTATMPKTARCKSTVVGGVRIYSGNCVIPGLSLRQTKLKLTASTQISGNWSILAGQTVDLSPGTYWVTGDFNLQSGAVLECLSCSNAQGTGVTIILTAQTNKVGALSIAANATLNLNAPRSGQFAGLVIVQDSNNLPSGTSFTSNQSAIGGTAGSSLNGLIYFPLSSLTFRGSPSPAGPKCLLLVSSSVKIDAASNLDTMGCAAAGLTRLPSIGKVALAA
jgi:hypothetical protein